MKRYVLVLIFILISNSIVFSQITGIDRSQKKEITNGLKAGEEYKKLIKKHEDTIDKTLLVINQQDSLLVVKDKRIAEKDNIIRTYELEQGGNLEYINDLEKENNKLYRKVGFWRGLTLIATVLGTLAALR